MSIVLWILQFALAIAFVLTGLVKVLQPYEVLADRMAWVQDYSPGLVRGIGALEILGGIGLVLPALLGVLPILTPLAAAGLAVIMALAVLHHLRSHERGQVLFTAALLILLVIVAWGRFSLAPL
ncbi:MAG: DoxX family protein [Candidatus Nanopelagicales bacterium]|nr:DoxX family protein [Candidatus Nanopelagicales bacterium]MCF8537955.1 DoxX family protein [Candidatus Nanopelagicales bacterium]MCF8542825.1 DoxX family protein [Candidatus Nanopelagicales bacterium]MCF8557309.1 DoxX family protein [Candidatus Nanopelagicales bacterium]